MTDGPLDIQLKFYLLTALLSGITGLGVFLSEGHDPRGLRFWVTLIGKLIGSITAGFTALWFCAANDVDPLITAVTICIAATAGTEAIRFLAKKL